MATLYRKYRPQNFKEILGQNHIKITLEHEIETGKIAHAYLFCGPRGTGKTTIARIFAKSINCIKKKSGEHDPCNECDNCAEITQGRSLDIVEIDAASHTGVDNVRDNIIASARVAPSKCKFKVFIIDEVHMLSTSAFNALLKNIEEPPAFVVFILCTTEIHKVPTTIISRCQRFDFKRVNITDIVKKLQLIADKEEIVIDRKILEAVARQSEGHMRDAESLLGQVLAIGGKEITEEEASLVIPRSDIGEAIRLIDCLAKKDAGSAIALVNKLVDEGVDLKAFITDLIELLRKIMLSKISPALGEKLGLELGEDIELKINDVSRGLNLNQAIIYIDKFLEVKNELKGSFIIQLPIEIAIAELCTLMVRPAINTSQISQPQYPSRKLANTAAKNDSSDALEKKSPVEARINISREEILGKWNEVLARVKKYNHSLSFILRACQPRDINENKLCLAFKYKFHRDRITDDNIKLVVEKVLHEVYGKALLFEALIDETIEVNDSGNSSYAKGEADGGAVMEGGKESQTEGGAEGENMINNLLKAFGGKIVK